MSADRKHGLAWDEAQNTTRRKARGIVFEDIAFHLERGDILDILEHPNADRFVGRRVFVVRRYDDVFLVPFVEEEHAVFLKTIIPGPKATDQRLSEETEP